MLTFAREQRTLNGEMDGEEDLCKKLEYVPGTSVSTQP
jgi:hypothetical protein